MAAPSYGGTEPPHPTLALNPNPNSRFYQAKLGNYSVKV